MMMWLFSIGLVGIVSGWVMGTSAAGWGALSVPLLILLGVDPLVAVSSSLLASILLSLFGGVTHWRYDRSRVRGLPSLLVGGMGGAFVGSLVSPTLSGPVLKLLIGVTTLIMGLLTLLRQNGLGPRDPGDLKAVKWEKKHMAFFGIGAVAGLSAGAFGTGWGPIGVTLLLWAGIPPHTVIGSSLMSRTLVAATASSSYLLQSDLLRWEILLPLFLSGAGGVWLGVRTSNGLPPGRLRKFLGGVVTLLGVFTIAKIFA
jgi:uncharacterized membrane protein YfcA